MTDINRLTTKYYCLSNDKTIMPAVCLDTDRYVAVIFDTRRGDLDTFKSYQNVETAPSYRQLKWQLLDLVLKNKDQRVTIHRLLDQKPRHYIRTYIKTYRLEEKKTSKTIRNGGGVCEECMAYRSAHQALKSHQRWGTKTKLIPVITDCKACAALSDQLKQQTDGRLQQLQTDCRNYPTPNCLNGNNGQILQRTSNAYGLRAAESRKYQALANLAYNRAPVV